VEVPHPSSAQKRDSRSPLSHRTTGGSGGSHRVGQSKPGSEVDLARSIQSLHQVQASQLEAEQDTIEEENNTFD
jgi:hypothetical protein